MYHSVKVESSIHLKIVLHLFMLLMCEHFLYILDMDSFSDRYKVKIFPGLPSYLFIF